MITEVRPRPPMAQPAGASGDLRVRAAPGLQRNRSLSAQILVHLSRKESHLAGRGGLEIELVQCRDGMAEA